MPCRPINILRVAKFWDYLYFGFTPLRCPFFIHYCLKHQLKFRDAPYLWIISICIFLVLIGLFYHYVNFQLVSLPLRWIWYPHYKPWPWWEKVYFSLKNFHLGNLRCRLLIKIEEGSNSIEIILKIFRD